MRPINTLGAPASEHRHHQVRQAASLIAALAGATGVLGIAFVIIGTVSPAEGIGVYVAIVVLLAAWMTGLWWRWDSPDRRDPNHERERRGF